MQSTLFLLWDLVIETHTIQLLNNSIMTSFCLS